MAYIKSETEAGVMTIRMVKGETNPLSPEMVGEIAKAVRTACEDSEVKALMLTSSSEKFFSIGLDIPSIFSLPRAGFESFILEFESLCMEIYKLEKPTVAAITGHATAGGCILALCFDHRIMAEGRKVVGLNEVKLGVPVPYSADRVLTDLVGSRNASEIMETGDFYSPDQALELGLVDKVAAQWEVEELAMERAVKLGELPSEAFAMIKRNRTSPVIQAIELKEDERRSHFVDCWYSDPVRERLKEAMKKF